MSTLNQSRRAFLKTTGATLAGVATVGMAAQLPARALAEGNDAAASVDDITWDEEFDVVVVGAGLAGMAAATTVAYEGAGKTCLLLEKSAAELGGGNSQYSAGMVLWTNDTEKFTEYLKELRGDMNNTPDDVLAAYTAGIAENLDWARSLSTWLEDEANVSEHFEEGSGSSCYPEYGELPHAFSLGRFNFMHMGDTSGKQYKYNHVQQVIYDEMMLHEDVVTFKHEAPMTALVQDPATKRIVGVTYEFEGATVYAKANKGVVMCCGGFENNKQMRADYLSGATARPVASHTNDGDGITACAKVGADMWHMNSCAGFWTSLSLIEGDHTAMRSPKKQGITVGVNGRRFYMDYDMDVVVDWDAMAEGDLTTHVGCRHGHMQFGGEWPHLPMPKDTWLIMDAAGYQAGMSDGFPTFGMDPIEEGGYGYQADTLEDLAEQAGLPAEELTKTVERWNECCANGEDPYFFRPANTLTPIEAAPFYALHCSATMLNTDGGPRRSAKGEVLDLDGDPIPGLYSAGEFGSIWCNMYNGGGNLGECLAFGRISVRNALGIA